jgi:hypothetical protein
MVPNSKPRKTYLGFNTSEIKLIAAVVLGVMVVMFFFYGPDLLDSKNKSVGTDVVSNSNNDTSPPAVSSPIAEKATVPTVSATPTPAPFDWKTAEVNEENVKEALGDVGGAFSIPVNDDTLRKIVVNNYGDKNIMVYIVVNPGAFWDEKDFVKKSGGSLVDYSKILFENEQVYEVVVKTMIDNVGGGENPGVDISWRRDQTEGVDYEAVMDNMFGDISIPYQLARHYSIPKEIYDKLKDFDLPASLNP